jgi:hypothetical protein
MDRADTRVPVTATLNGVKAKSRAEIMERFKPIGLAELTGRDTDTPGMSIVCGGIMTAPNQRRTTLNTGMWLQAIPPDPDEAATPGGLVPTDGALANGRGRVPWVVDEYDPGHYNFYDGERVRTVLCRGVLRIRLNGEVDIDATGPPKDELLTDKRYREALQV